MIQMFQAKKNPSPESPIGYFGRIWIIAILRSNLDPRQLRESKKTTTRDILPIPRWYCGGSHIESLRSAHIENEGLNISWKKNWDGRAAGQNGETAGLVELTPTYGLRAILHLGSRNFIRTHSHPFISAKIRSVHNSWKSKITNSGLGCKKNLIRF